MAYWYQPVREPRAEIHQDNRWNGVPRRYNRDLGPTHGAPREVPFTELDPGLRIWHQGPKILPKFKPNYYFTRPHDGKRSGTWARFKDALTGEGADVFITSSGDKRTLMRDRPQRWAWTGWGMTPDQLQDMKRYDKDFRWQDLKPIIDTRFTAGKRFAKPFYNFQDREWKSAREVWRHPERIWINARWPEGARYGDRMPWSMMDIDSQWFTRVPHWAGRYAGGRLRQPW